MPIAAPEEAPSPLIREDVPPPPPPMPEIGFANPLAVRIGVMVALVSSFAAVLASPLVPLPLVCLVGGGFLSVYLYRRRTGHLLNPVGAARIGWMTGLFAFLLFLLTLAMIVMAVSDQEMVTRLVAEMRARGADVSSEMVIDAFRNPANIAQVVILAFLMFTVLPAIGGALGAKFLGGRTRT